MSVYTEILKLNESELKYLSCDLDNKRVYCKSECVFEEGAFKVQTMQQLIELHQNESAPEVWKPLVGEMYARYAACIPRDTVITNFRTADKRNLNYFTARNSFHHDRIALELYILFHSVQQDLIWPNPHHFFEKICESCIVYKTWLLD